PRLVRLVSRQGLRRRPLRLRRHDAVGGDRKPPAPGARGRVRRHVGGGECAVGFVEASAGESLGKLYVDAYFPPASKARMEKLVANLLAAYRDSIDAIDWMSPATKQEAQAKLATFAPKIGYPKRWIDYGSLETKKGDLLGNV